MKLQDPLTSDEIEMIDRVVMRGGTLGLCRTGIDDEKYTCISLIAKMIFEFKQLKIGVRP